jgi:hypothetical protein
MQSGRENIAGLSAWVLGIVVCSLTAGLASADEWHVNPRVVLSGIYDDNFRLDSIPADKIRVSGGAMVASTQFLFEDPKTHFEITPKIHATVFPGNSEFQGNDEFIDSVFSERWEKARFSVNADFWRQLVLMSFLPNTDLTAGLGKSIGVTDIGAITERNRQDFILVSPTGSYDLTPRLRLEAQTQFLDIKYTDQITGVRQNFTNYGGGLGVSTQVTPVSTLSVRGNASQFKPDLGTKSETYGLQAQWTLRQTAVQQAYARVGIDHTQFDQPQAGTPAAIGPAGSSNSFSGGLGISRKFQTTDLFADLMRSVSPQASGVVVAQDELRLRLEHQFSARSAGFIGVRGIKDTALQSNSAPQSSTAYTNERYVTASAGFEWRLLREFSVTSQYTYTSLKTDLFTSTANSNAIGISLIYEPHRLAESAPVLGD